MCGFCSNMNYFSFNPPTFVSRYRRERQVAAPELGGSRSHVLQQQRQQRHLLFLLGVLVFVRRSDRRQPTACVHQQEAVLNRLLDIFCCCRPQSQWLTHSPLAPLSFFFFFDFLSARADEVHQIHAPAAAHNWTRRRIKLWCFIFCNFFILLFILVFFYNFSTFCLMTTTVASAAI